MFTQLKLRKRLVAALVIILAVGLTAGLAVRRSANLPDTTSPTTTSPSFVPVVPETTLVEPDWEPVDKGTARDTEAALVGPVTAVAEVAKKLVAEQQLTPTKCESIATELGQITDPDTYQLAAASVPDQPLQELLVSTTAALANVLSACHSGDANLSERQATLRELVHFTDLRRAEVAAALR